MRRMLVFMAALLVLAVSGCAPQADAEAERAAVRTALGEAWDAVITRDVDKFVSICADEDIMFPPNAPIVRGKQEVREYMSQFFASPGYSISRQPPQIEVSGAGDLAYTWDTFELTVNDAEGNPVTQNAKHVVVWKKEPQGTWKIVADIWNSDLPATSE